MSEIKVNKIVPRVAAGDVQLGNSGDTLTVANGADLIVGGDLVIASGGSITAQAGSTQAGMGLFVSYAVIADHKSSGVAGGTFTSGAWQTRDLNTEVFDPDGIVTITSNQFTLGAGTYRIHALAPAGNVGPHQTRIQNVTDATTVALGQNQNGTVGGGYDGAHSEVICRTTIASSKTFEIQHRCTTTGGSDSFGLPCSFGTEVYTVVEIFKEAQ